MKKSKLKIRIENGKLKTVQQKTSKLKRTKEQLTKGAPQNKTRINQARGSR